MSVAAAATLDRGGAADRALLNRLHVRLARPREITQQHGGMRELAALPGPQARATGGREHGREHEQEREPPGHHGVYTRLIDSNAGALGGSIRQPSPASMIGRQR